MDDGGEESPDGPGLFATTVREGVVEIARPGTTWLSTGWGGGRTTAEAVHSVHVPEGWGEADRPIDEYVDRRISRAEFERTGPVLLTGVDAEHLRGARCGPVEAYATAGVSNPAPLPTDPDGPPRAPEPRWVGSDETGADERADEPGDGEGYPDEGPGTVNVVVGTDRALAPGALANLVAVAAEAKAATLLKRAGVPGTTTDATIVACDPDGERTAYSGSATVVGAAARACVREAVGASLDARYDGGDPPDPDDAEYPVATDARAAVFDPID